MNNEEAKFILQGYRSNGMDAGDPTFGPALDQTRSDPALNHWFAREQAFDGAISAKLGQIQAPAGLREAILAGARVTAPGPVRRAWWRQPTWMAVAASVALLGAVGLALWPRNAVANAPLTAFILNDAVHSETHGGHGEETGVLQARLNEPATRIGDGLPVDFAALRKAGCRAVTFEGHDVLEVCFNRDGVWFHFYIMERADFPALTATLAPALWDRNGISVASWADTSHLFVLVSKKGRAVLEKLL